MTDTRATQVFVNAATSSSANVQSSQLYVLAAILFPAENVNAYQTYVNAAVSYMTEVRVTQAYVLAAIRTRTANPSLRAWTYTMDGHDFYVLALGDAETLVFDNYSRQWSVWATEGVERWRVSHGINWQGATSYAASYGSNVLCGDDTLGVLYFLDPNLGYDESPLSGAEEPSYFKRRATGQITVRGVNAVPCYEAFLVGSLGSPQLTAPNVNLYTSDDAGNTYVDHGAITVTTDDFNQRLVWNSLGQAEMPGRLFRIEDYGALARLDSLDVNDGSNA